MKTGIYIHVPFCLKKCNYCDFVSFENSYERVGEYIAALCREMAWYEGEEADTVYLGGGTPSSLPIESIEQIMEGVRSHFKLDPDTEVTMEVNPKTADLEYFKQLRAAGINRLSIGLQSLDDHELSALGRLHTAQEGLECVKLAQEAGFDNISVDLMFGLPDQTFDSFISTVDRVMNLDIQHISCYSLTIEDGTPMQKLHLAGKLNLPGEEVERCMYETAVELLTQSGYKMYEISNFARIGFQSRHNLKYWTRVPYIGLGVAAASLYKEERFNNPATLEDYYKLIKKGRSRSETTILTDRDRQNEFLFLGLRMNEGVDLEEFKRLFGKDLFDVYGKTIQWYQNLKMMVVSGGRLRLTLKGMNVSNSILSDMYD